MSSIMKLTLPDKPMSAMEIFEFVREADCYANTCVAYRILFTVPVTVASAERNFSKLKLLKNHLRSTMSQERLNGLATLCIEKKLLDEIDINAIIDDFASRKHREMFEEIFKAQKTSGPALDWACGQGGADCTPLQPGGRCYQPDTLLSHASYAFNIFYQQNGNSDIACNFGGAGAIIKRNPSFGSCKFLASETSAASALTRGSMWMIFAATSMIFLHLRDFQSV